MGDGIIFSVFMCLGIFAVGAIAHLAQCAGAAGCAPFTSLSALGGAVWATANFLTVPATRALGVGQTMIAWGCAEMLTGWATSRFGLFGLSPEPVRSAALNSAGVALGVASIAILAAAAPAEEGEAAAAAAGGDAAPLLSLAADDAPALAGAAGASAGPGVTGAGGRDAAAAAAAFFDEYGFDASAALPPARRRAFGVAACVLAGMLSGSMFTPAQYVVDHPAAFPAASRRLSDHLFAHNTGVLLAAAGYAALYALAARGRPWASPRVVLPGLVSGVIWGLACVAWFAANERLSLVIAFPLVTLGPGIVSMLVGGLFFGEVRGRREAALLAAAVATFCAAGACLGLSGGAGA